MDDISKSNPSLPEMEPAGEFTVLGFLVTPLFNCVLGKGDDAAAKVKYEFTGNAAKFTFSTMTSDKKARAVVTLPKAATNAWEIVVNGKRLGTVPKGQKVQAEAAIDSVIEFRAEREK